MFLIVGLGNPGEKYTGTRHNLGFKVLEEFRKKLNLGEWSSDKKLKSELLKISSPLIAHDSGLILARPQTYMNKSGLAVAVLANYYKIASEDIVIVHDELDIPLGHLKIRLGGAAAGHHGVESIIDSLATDKFIRLRLGIGTLKALSGEHKQISFNAEHFVLETFSQNEQSKVKHLIKKAINALEILLDKGLEKTQHQFN